jgi:hypothetical protein
VFDDQRLAARAAASAMREATALEARLLLDGHVAPPDALNALEAELRELLRGVGASPNAEC